VIKRIVIIVSALLLAVPALSAAGSATSMWDVSIGGYVKADFGWADQGVGADYTDAKRASTPVAENRTDKYGATFMAAGQTRLNLSIKGPDAWTAKTSAFIEGEFSGAVGTPSAYGLFRLRHAFLKMDWSDMSLLFGQYWETWGVMFVDYLGRLDFNNFRQGSRAPQIRFTHTVTPQWSYYFGVYQPNTNSQGQWNTIPSDANRSYWPNLFGELTFQTDKWGKIGSDTLLLAAGGMFGKEKVTYQNPASPGTWGDDTINMWAISLKGFIPIIPEKKGDKAGSLYIKGSVMYGQNYRFYAPAAPPYNQGIGSVISYAAPTSYDWQAQLTYYLTDKVWANFIYGSLANNVSYAYQWRAGMPSGLRSESQWAINLLYDVNQAIRFGVEYSQLTTGYTQYAPDDGAIPTAVFGRSGKLNAVRGAAWYFF
jgi:hypothetical protein